MQRLFRLQSCLSRKSSISENYSKTFFACRNVLAANHHYPGNIQTSSPAELSQQQIIGFPKYSKTFSPAELSQPKIINIRELFKNFFCLQTCRSRKSPIFRKYSKAFSPAEQHQEQVIKIPELFKDFFACRVVLAANHQYPGNVQRFFRLQNCLGRKSSISRKNSKTYWPAQLSQPQVISIPERFKDFFARRIVPSANHQYPGNIKRLFCLQKCLSRKSSISRKYPKTSSPAELSQQQIINTPQIFKDFFACRIVLAANHQYPGNIQRLLRLQSCLSSKSSKPGNIQRLFCLQKCLSRKSSISRKNSMTFPPADLHQPQIINIPKKLKDLLACRVVLAENHHYPRTIQKLFLPVELSQPQITNIPEIFKGFFACRIVLGASHQNPGIN